MFAHNIQPNFLRERLDADIYAPRFIEARARLTASGLVVSPLSSAASKVKCGPFGSSLHAEAYVADRGGVPFVQPTAFSSGEFSLDKAERISAADHARLASTRFTAPALVFARVGNTYCSSVPQSVGSFNIHGDVIGLQPCAGIDSEYVESFFHSPTGQALLHSIQAGTTRPRIGTSALASLPFLKPHPDAQTYIGNKVRQAEALRTVARTTLGEVDGYHRSLIPQPSSSLKKNWSRVGPDRLAERLDAEFYPGAVDIYFDNHQGDVALLDEVSSAVFNGTTLATTDGAGVLQATVANLSATFLEPEFRRVALKGRTNKQIKDGDILICAAAHNASYIGKDITFATTGEEPVVPSTEVLLVRPDREQVPSSYLRAYFQSPIGYLQIQACVRGITAHLYPADLLMVRIPVPNVAESEREAWFALDDDLVDAAEQVSAARLLTRAARLLVEALIERKVSEVDLVAAHKNPEADRALLERLTADGIDVPNTDPLFPDLDRLEELLTETQAEEAE